MTERTIHEKYFRWLCCIVVEKGKARLSYKKILRLLYETEFYAILPMDENRADDGVQLRYRYLEDVGLSQNIAVLFDNNPCSVLEMMIALSLRCEKHIMENAELGDRTGQWFWNMMVSLGLGVMDDEHYDKNQAQNILHKFLERDYRPNGSGGLFTLRYTDKDLRNEEIWYQMCGYLVENFSS